MSFTNFRSPKYVISQFAEVENICNRSDFKNSYTGFDENEYRTYIQNTYFEKNGTLVKDKDMSEELKIAYKRENNNYVYNSYVPHKEKQLCFAEAFKRYEILSDFKNVTAKFNLARLYRDGIFDEYTRRGRFQIVLDNDFDKALELYKELFDSGYIEAMFYIGMTYQRKYERFLGLYLSIPDFATRIKHYVETEMNDNVEKSLNCYIKGFELDYQNNRVSLEKPSNKNLYAFIRLINYEYDFEYCKDYINKILTKKSGGYLYIFASNFSNYIEENMRKMPQEEYYELSSQLFNYYLRSAKKGNPLARLKVRDLRN